jgi:hypothetical protein
MSQIGQQDESAGRIVWEFVKHEFYASAACGGLMAATAALFYAAKLIRFLGVDASSLAIIEMVERTVLYIEAVACVLLVATIAIVFVITLSRMLRNAWRAR